MTPDTDKEAVAEVVSRIIRHCARGIPHSAEITPDLELIEAGVDSLALVEIIAGLEAEFDRDLPDELLSEEVFRTPGSITEAMVSLVAGPIEPGVIT
jgi:nodulation protein F